MTLSFRSPFALSALDERLPAGVYNVDIDEEAIDGLSFLAFRRTQTLLHTPALSGSGATNRFATQVFAVDGDELTAAFQADGRAAASMKDL